MPGSTGSCLFQPGHPPSLNLRKNVLLDKGDFHVMGRGSWCAPWAPLSPVHSSELAAVTQSGRVSCHQGTAWALLPPSPNHLKSQPPLRPRLLVESGHYNSQGPGRPRGHAPTHRSHFVTLTSHTGAGGVACLSKPRENTGLRGLAHLPLFFKCKFSRNKFLFFPLCGWEGTSQKEVEGSPRPSAPWLREFPRWDPVRDPGSHIKG